MEADPQQAPRPVRPEEKASAERRVSLVAWICLVIVYIVWGSTYLAIRVGVETMPPLLMAAARNLVAGLIMFAVSFARLRGALRRSLPRRSFVAPQSRRRRAPSARG